MKDRIKYSAIALSAVLLAGALYIDWRSVLLAGAAYGVERLRRWALRWYE